MSFWINLWKIVLILGLVLFGALAVWVTIGGAKDIKQLFIRLREDRDEE